MMRGSTPRAREDLFRAALAHRHVELTTDLHVTAIMGETWVSGVQVDGAPDMLACQGVFVFIGGDPDTALVPPGLPLDTQGAIVTDAHGASLLPGLWAIGAVRSDLRSGLREAGADAIRTIAALDR